MVRQRGSFLALEEIDCLANKTNWLSQRVVILAWWDHSCLLGSLQLPGTTSKRVYCQNSSSIPETWRRAWRGQKMVDNGFVMEIFLIWVSGECKCLKNKIYICIGDHCWGLKLGKGTKLLLKYLFCLFPLDLLKSCLHSSFSKEMTAPLKPI